MSKKHDTIPAESLPGATAVQEPPVAKAPLTIPRPSHFAIKVFHDGKRYGGFIDQAAAEVFIERRGFEGAEVRLIETDEDGRPLDEIGKRPPKLPPKFVPKPNRSETPTIINDFLKSVRGRKDMRVLSSIPGEVNRAELLPDLRGKQKKLTLTIVYGE